MNYREKQKKDPAEKKLRKLSVYRKKYPDRLPEGLTEILDWEEAVENEIGQLQETGSLLPNPGEELFMTGWIGGAGTLIVADWKKEQLCTRFPAAFVRTARDREVFTNFSMEAQYEYQPPSTFATFAMSPAPYVKAGASWIAPVGEGGLMKALYRLGKESGLGFRVQAREVPVRQITIEFSEFFLLHPWEMLTGNGFLFTADHNADILKKLESDGIPFKKIGFITKEKQKLICHGEEQSNINRPEPDGILTLLLEDTER
ncbi:MAG: AIR synthase-related protein [Lachnospiraceae bacterium]|nr:AIR synthase-related protein [Lachnospiraceae bacterium]